MNRERMRAALYKDRVILMKAMNRYDLKLLEYGKPQLYGRAADTVQDRA
jgi:hypothetical protein